MRGSVRQTLFFGYTVSRRYFVNVDYHFIDHFFPVEIKANTHLSVAAVERPY